MRISILIDLPPPGISEANPSLTAIKIDMPTIVGFFLSTSHKCCIFEVSDISDELIFRQIKEAKPSIVLTT
jgi:hypothetical protein